MEYSYNNYTLKYDNVYYGMTRDTNMFIVYDELYYVKNDGENMTILPWKG